jgi:predicted transcriptional regulator
VSNESIAEELGVRPGDIINSVNGECIATKNISHVYDLLKNSHLLFFLLLLVGELKYENMRESS